MHASFWLYLKWLFPPTWQLSRDHPALGLCVGSDWELDDQPLGCLVMDWCKTSPASRSSVESSAGQSAPPASCSILLSQAWFSDLMSLLEEPPWEVPIKMALLYQACSRVLAFLQERFSEGAAQVTLKGLCCGHCCWACAYYSFIFGKIFSDLSFYVWGKKVETFPPYVCSFLWLIFKGWSFWVIRVSLGRGSDSWVGIIISHTVS